MLLKQLPPAAADPLVELIATFAADPAPEKVDLGIGIYKDEAGEAPVLGSVKRAERWLLENQASKSYLSPAGDPAFNAAMQELLFGPRHPALTDGRVRTIQTPGASGALRIAAELIRRVRPQATIWVPRPTWANHVPIFRASGVGVREYRYYNRASSAIELDAMMHDLEGAAADDLVLVHGCCHNPSGADPDASQWKHLARFFAARGLMPLVDIAYQGFGTGVEEDAFALRLLAQSVPEMLVAASCSKSFALYRERTGVIALVAANAGDAANTHGHLLQLIRAMYSMPPDHGAAIVARVLQSPGLRQEWERELSGMRERIRAVRARFATLLASAANRDFSYLTAQNGMFSFLDIAPAQVERLRRQFHVHLVDTGRINVAALSDANIVRVANAIGAVLRGASSP